MNKGTQAPLFSLFQHRLYEAKGEHSDNNFSLRDENTFSPRWDDFLSAKRILSLRGEKNNSLY